MSASLSNTLRLSSSLKMDEEAKLIAKQGIVSILGSDCERAKAASLRRTLSADMSSKKWLAQHGFSQMKKIASSQQFIVPAADSSSSSSEGEDEYEEKKEAERPGLFQTWSSILSQKAGEESAKSGTLQLPYVHPLVKRSSSSLSEKSLQICTESLGSETGSDGFSSSSSSSPANTQEDKHDQQQQKQQQQQQQEKESSSLVKEEVAAVERDDYNYYHVRKRSLQPQSSFPPPLPSLSPNQGPNVRFHTHRQNGRLVLEAVSVTTENYFQAQRHGGRLVLTFANTLFNHEDMSDEEQDDEEEEAEEFGQEFENFAENQIQMDEDENGEAEVEEGEVVKVGKANEFNQEMEPAPKLPGGMINVHRSALMMKKKLMGLANRNPTWPPKLNKAANLEEATPLPPPPRVARSITTPPATTAASSFNVYEYCWRSKPPTATTVLNPPSIPLKNNSDKFILSKSSKAQEQQQLLLLRGNKAEYSVPLLRGCKEPRRSLVIWEPYCIATS